MYDTFEPFYKIEKSTFTFKPSRFEIWLEGKMIDSGKSILPIYFVATNIDGEEKVRATIFDSALFTQIEEKPVFDEFITGKDRLQLITIPKETNTNCGGIAAFNAIMGPTREFKDFQSNEPYVCNLFMKDDVLMKVTFAFSNPEKLIEFYV